MNYWSRTPHLNTYTIEDLEAWHRDAWDREQNELGDLIGQSAAEHMECSVITVAAFHPQVA